MIASMHITNRGAHETLDINFAGKGKTTVRGPTATGKTTLLAAACDILWGCDQWGTVTSVSAIRTGQDKMTSEMTLVNGVTLSTSMLRSGRVTRSRTLPDGTVEKFKTKGAWLKAMGPLGEKALEARIAMVPMAWKDLAEGNARKLRDLFQSLLPTEDLGEEIDALMQAAGFHFMTATDPTTEKLAGEWRTEANRDKNKAAGAFEELQTQVEELEAEQAEPVSPAAVAAAKAVDHAVLAYDGYGEALSGYEATVIERDHQQAEVAAWNKAMVDLGPVPDGAGVDAAAEAFGLADAKVAELEVFAADMRVKKDRSALKCREVPIAADRPESVAARNRLHLAIETLERTPDDGKCGTCGKAWAQAKKARKDAEDEVDAARANLEQVKRSAETAYQNEMNGLSKANQAAAKLVNDNDDALVVARQERDTARSALALANIPVEEYHSAVESIGPKPTVMDKPTAPNPPEMAAPTIDEIDQANQTLSLHNAAEAIALKASGKLSNATARLAKADSLVATTAAEADRMKALVNAVRQAPSVIAARQAKALGLPPEITLVWGAGDAQSPAVVPMFDGVHYKRAATGRGICCGLSLRARIRVAIGLPYLPLFVDEAQSVTGQELPDVGGPVIVLVGDDLGPIRAEVVA